jgi:hypothetical protein
MIFKEKHDFKTTCVFFYKRISNAILATISTYAVLADSSNDRSNSK